MRESSAGKNAGGGPQSAPSRPRGRPGGVEQVCRAPEVSRRGRRAAGGTGGPAGTIRDEHGGGDRPHRGGLPAVRQRVREGEVLDVEGHGDGRLVAVLPIL